MDRQDEPPFSPRGIVSGTTTSGFPFVSSLQFQLYDWQSHIIEFLCTIGGHKELIRPIPGQLSVLRVDTALEEAGDQPHEVWRSDRAMAQAEPASAVATNSMVHFSRLAGSEIAAGM